MPEITLFLAPEEPGLKTRLDDWMRENKFTGSYGSVDEQPVLRLRGTGIARVQSALVGGNLVGESLNEEASPDDRLPPPTFKERFKSNIVRFAAGIYIFSNTVTTIGGWLRVNEAKSRVVGNDPEAIKFRDDHLSGGKNQMRMGTLFNVGDGFMLAFGHRSAEQQLDSVARRLGDFVHSNSWTIPDSSPIRLAQKRNASLPQRMGNFLRENIIPLKATTEILASFFGILSGLDLKIKGKVVAGSLIASGFILSQIVPERKTAYFREEEERKSAQRDFGLGGSEKKGFFGRTWDAIKHKPMLLTGVFTIGNNVSSLIGAAGESRIPIGIERTEASKNFWAVDATAQTTFIAANTLLALSSKNNTERASTIMDHAYSMASDLILCQSEDIRPRVTKKLAEFLADQPEVDATPGEAFAALNAQVAAKACLLMPPAQPEAVAQESAPSMVAKLGLEPRLEKQLIDRAPMPLERGPLERLTLQRQHAENHRPKGDAVPGEWRETVRGQEAQQEAHDHQRG